MIETARLRLRAFEGKDLEALHALLSDREVNTFLPWFPVKDLAETEQLLNERLNNKTTGLAICLRTDDVPIGYITVAAEEPYDLGYALRREFWHRGIVTEAARALISQLQEDGLPYVTATHDRDNPRSGGVMRRLGMKYCYSWREQWQPKNIPVVFRLYQLNLDGDERRVCRKYQALYPEYFVEAGV